VGSPQYFDLPTAHCILPTDMATVTDIPFHQIPRQTPLFLNYIQSLPASLRFYQQPPTLESIETVARDRIQAIRFPRAEIAAILRKQNQAYGCDAVTLDNIGKLENPECVAVLTGQQVGLFTGPLYTMYKALTAVRLADELRHRGVPAVPVFWMETEDHDLAEVTHRTLVNADSSLHTVDFKDLLFDQAPAGPVGSIRFPENIRQVVEVFLRSLPEGNWKAEIRSELEDSCKPGITFGQSFAELLTKSFAGLGLILFDPHDTEAKCLTASVYQTALRSAEEIRSSLLSRNHELESSGFHAQVSVLDSSTVLFYMDHGERRAIEQAGGSQFRLKNSSLTFSLSELLDCASRTPEKFSPNVLLRPLIQDHLFPTVAYVGGSAELAYFAQIEILYKRYGRPMPVIWPRDSFTLIEYEVASEMNRLGLSIQDCFPGQPSAIEKAIRNSGLSQAPAILESLQTRLDEVLTEIKPELHTVESPLAEALETARRKILHNVQHLKSQLIRLEGTRMSSLSQSVDLVMNHCYPHQTLQEREFGIQYFYARHGSSLLHTVHSAINVNSFVHHVIHL
jgi:bacillithiol synthase